MGEWRLHSPPKRGAKLHQQRVENRPLRQHSYHNQGSPNVVPGYQISKVLREWIVKYLAERPLNQQTEFMGPVNYIAEHAGVSTRQVSRVANGELEVVAEKMAEKLLMAVGLEHMMMTDEIQVVPSPYWSTEKWVEYMQSRGCY